MFLWNYSKHYKCITRTFPADALQAEMLHNS